MLKLDSHFPNKNLKLHDNDDARESVVHEAEEANEFRNLKVRRFFENVTIYLRKEYESNDGDDEVEKVLSGFAGSATFQFEDHIDHAFLGAQANHGWSDSAENGRTTFHLELNEDEIENTIRHDNQTGSNRNDRNTGRTSLEFQNIHDGDFADATETDGFLDDEEWLQNMVERARFLRPCLHGDGED